MNLESFKQDYDSNKMSKESYIEKCYTIHKHLFEYKRLLPQTDVKKIEITADDVVFYVNHRALNKYNELEPIALVVPDHDERVTPIEMFNFSTYELDDFSMIVNLIGPQDTILDIGANVGFHSLSLSKLYTEAKFYCFEPILRTFNYLKKNLELSKSSKIQLFNFGFSNEIRDATFYYYKSGSGNASLVNLTNKGDVENVISRLDTVDHFVDSNNLKVNFIKCDVEGAELFVFQGAIKCLTESRPIVFSEILRKWSSKFGYNPNEIFKLFFKLDYKAFIVHKNKLVKFQEMTDETVETNFFFIPEEKLENIGYLLHEKN